MFQRFIGCIKSADFDTLFVQGVPKKVLTDIPHICHERHEYIRVNFFWPVEIFTDLTRKIGIFDRFYAKSGVFFLHI